MLKVAIIGCGKIADAHASQIQRIEGCEMVAACDREILMAEQLRDRFPIKQSFNDAERMLVETKPDVVHITTPPSSHYDLGRLCLDAGSHVYMEKPFAVNGRETDSLLQQADRRGLKMTAGHDLQFSPVARRMRQIVTDGYLGGPPVHMESYYCYDLSDPKFARALLSDKNHWVRSLPGKLLHNIISHGIARIAEFLPTSAPEVVAHGFVSPTLRSLGEWDIADELRVTISDRERTTAYFTFSSQMRPSLNQFRLYGLRNGLVLDETDQTLIQVNGACLRSFAQIFINPLRLARQYRRNVRSNATLFLGNRLHMKGGMHALIEAFYRSIRTGSQPPIAYREIILTARIMDDIFGQIGGCNPILAKKATLGS